MKTSIILEYAEKDYADTDIFAKARDAWKKAGNKKADLRTMDMYIKPEENQVYFVGNASKKDECSGSFALD